MELQDKNIIPASLDVTWAALNDPAILKKCIMGCESLEQTGDNAYVAVVAVKVGPVNAKFTGELHLLDIKPPHSYTIKFDGKGGVAGFGKGSADVSLADVEGQTELSYQVRAQVGGKIAQIGSRLVDATAAKLADDFFRAFEQQLRNDNATAVVLEERAQGGTIESAAAVTIQPQKKSGKWLWLLIAAAALVIGYAAFA